MRMEPSRVPTRRREEEQVRKVILEDEGGAVELAL
jgi:hypothetical protein